MVLSHTPVVGCDFMVGAVAKWGAEKSKNSVISSAAPSRAVSAVNPKRTSISFKIEVKSRGVCETNFGFEYGETTHTGIRKPE